MKFKRDTPKKIVSLLLSVTYLLVTQPFFHDHDEHHEHHHHEAHEGAIHETDDCHNFIYHGVTQKIRMNMTMLQPIFRSA